ncbi:MAG: polysaccharide pyruvyl transferase family protein [Desulfoprunum sp.]
MNNRAEKDIMQGNFVPYKVCLMGASLDTGNKGVSALCASFVKSMLEVKPDAEIKLFLGNRSSNPQQLKLAKRDVVLEVINFRMSPKAKLEKNLLWIFFLACLQKITPLSLWRQKIIHGNCCLHEIAQADFIGDVRGGDSFSDIYGLKSFIISSLPVVVVILLRKKLILLPQTYGPFDSFIAKIIACFIIKHADKLYSRDLASIDYVEKLSGNCLNKKSIQFCPDMAFKLDSIAPEHIDIAPPLEFEKKHPLIGINVNGLMYNGGYTGKNMFGLKVIYKELIVHLIEKILEETEAHVLFVPHTFGAPGNINSDPDASQKIFSLLGTGWKNRLHMVSAEYDQSGIKGVINLCDFFIGSRMHACIAALSQHIPTVGIAYSKKFLGVFEAIGAGQTVLDARSLTEDIIIKHTLSFYHQRETISMGLEGNISEAQKTITVMFNNLIDCHDTR